MLQIIVDASTFGFDDDGYTTTYYGHVTVGNRTIECQGTDRDSINYYDDIMEAILQDLGLAADIEEWMGDGPYAQFYEDLRLKVDDGETFAVVQADAGTLRFADIPTRP